MAENDAMLALVEGLIQSTQAKGFCARALSAMWSGQSRIALDYMTFL